MSKTLTDMLFSLLFPRRPVCLLCGEDLPFGDDLICSGCDRRIVPLKPPLCIKCGKPQEKTSECLDCTSHHHYFAQARSYGPYEGALKKLIHEFKYRGNPEASRLLGQRLLETLSLQPWPSFDFIVPVPLHPKRRRERGYNQSLLLAKAVSRSQKVPLHRSLERVKDTEHQTLLDKACRRENLRGAFEVRRGQGMSGKTVLLVDDVYTTGATADACAKALKDAKVQEVFVLTLARG